MQRINRYVLGVVGAVALTMLSLGLVTVIFYRTIREHTQDIWLSIYSGLIVEIIFFGLVGVAVIIYQESEWRGESVRRRVEKVFANEKLNSSALEYVQEVIHRNSVYAVKAVQRLVVLSYDRTTGSYRVEFNNQFIFKNLFGDLDYNFSFSATIAPDLITDKLCPLGEVVSIRLKNSRGVREFVGEKTELKAEGFLQPVQLELRMNEEAIFEMEWWSWVTNVGNSGFSVKRFSEVCQLVVENRSNVTVRVFRPENPAEIITLRYRASCVVREAKNVPERTRLDVSWLPPAEYPSERSEFELGGGLHPILTREDRI